MARFFPRYSNSILQSTGRLTLALICVAGTLTSLMALPRAEKLGRSPEFIVGIAVVGLLLAFLLGRPAIKVLWARSRPLRYRNSPRWFADYAWDPQGRVLYSPLENGPTWLVAGLLVWSSVGYFVVLPASRLEGGWTPESTHTIWIGAALGLVLVGLGTLRVWRYFRYGTSTLVLADSPVPVGGLLRATFASSRPLTTIERFTVTSRCYRESTRRSSKGVKTTSVTCLGEESVTLLPEVL